MTQIVFYDFFLLKAKHKIQSCCSYFPCWALNVCVCLVFHSLVLVKMLHDQMQTHWRMRASANKAMNFNFIWFLKCQWNVVLFALFWKFVWKKVHFPIYRFEVNQIHPIWITGTKYNSFHLFRYTLDEMTLFYYENRENFEAARKNMHTQQQILCKASNLY